VRVLDFIAKYDLIMGYIAVVVTVILLLMLGGH
jgi:hypothetical protein